jgi:ABC-type dipeptide/oligopeptide/nickel transport system permease subunit
MSLAPAAPPIVPVAKVAARAAPGFWGDAWRRFRKKTVPMIALGYVLFLALIALFAPVIVGTKPIVCKYKGRIYFPCVGYLHARFENPIFRRDRFRNPFYKSLQEKDPNSWAIYPLIYQDPERRVGKEEVDALRPPKKTPATNSPAKGNDRKPAAPPAEPGFGDPFAQGAAGTEPGFGEPSSGPPGFGDPFGQTPGAESNTGDPFANSGPDAEPEKDIDDGPPNAYHWMGVTNANRIDVLAIIVHGTKIAMLIGFVTTGIASLIGITLGAIAGYAGGWIDILISRMTEFIMSIPVLILIIALLAVIDKPSIWQIMLVLGLTGWTSICRLTRAEFMKLRTLDYVSAAKALGASTPRILFRHILPNAMAPVLVPITFGIASAILIESGLSLLGLGSPPDTPSWGGLLNRGRENFETMWWLIVFPGLAIFSTVLAYNLVGEGLQEATDPRLREGAK